MTRKTETDVLRAEVEALRAEVALLRAQQAAHWCPQTVTPAVAPTIWPYGWLPGQIYVGDVPQCGGGGWYFPTSVCDTFTQNTAGANP